MLASATSIARRGNGFPALPRFGARAKRGWFAAPAYADLCAVADFRLWRFAITTVPTAEIASATRQRLCVKRACTAQEFFAFSASSTAARSYIDASGVLRTDLPIDQMRQDWSNGRRQLALSGQSTNQIRNNTMVGAGAGAAPSFGWGGLSGTVSGLTIAILGSVVEKGIACIDIAISGTATASGGLRFNAEASNQISAASGQVWTHCAYLRLVSGAMLGASLQVELREFASGTASGGLGGSTAALTANLSRFAYTRTLTDASCTHIQPTYRFGFLNGESYDLVLRLGLPQLEQLPFASPAIPTSGTAVTRAIETARFSPAIEAMLQGSAASLVVRGQNFLRAIRPIVGTATQSLLRSGGATAPIVVTSEGAAALSTASGADMSLSSWAAVLGFDAGGRSLLRNGTALVGDALATVADRTTVYLGRAGAASGDGHYDFVGIAPQRLSNTRLAELGATA